MTLCWKSGYELERAGKVIKPGVAQLAYCNLPKGHDGRCKPEAWSIEQATKALR